jgi:hypothetical protein
MKYFFKIIIISLTILCLGFTTKAPLKEYRSKNDDCLKQVKFIYSKMNKPPLTSKGGVYYFNYSVRSTFRKVSGVYETQKTTEATVDMYMSKEQMQYLSKDVSIYSDQQDVFTILNSHKIIYRSDPFRKEQFEQREKSISALQDTIFGMSSVSSCETLPAVIDGYTKIVTLQPNALAAQKFSIKKIIFYINAEKEEAKKIRIDYAGEHRMDNVEITYNKIDYNYKQASLGSSVKDRFVNRKSQLLSNYKDYKLIDNRAKKNKSISNNL